MLLMREDGEMVEIAEGEGDDETTVRVCRAVPGRSRYDDRAIAAGAGFVLHTNAGKSILAREIRTVRGS